MNDAQIKILQALKTGGPAYSRLLDALGLDVVVPARRELMALGVIDSRGNILVDVTEFKGACRRK